MSKFFSIMIFSVAKNLSLSKMWALVGGSLNATSGNAEASLNLVSAVPEAYFSFSCARSI